MARAGRAIAALLVIAVVAGTVVAVTRSRRRHRLPPPGHTRERTTERPLPPDAAMESLAAGNARFGMDLGRELASGSTEDICISPWSLGQGLAMLAEGARGQTLDEIRDVLHLSLPQGDVAPTCAKVANSLDLAAGGAVDLVSANGLWLGAGGNPSSEFLDAIASGYRGEAIRTRFPEPGRSQANAWISEQTGGRVSDALPDGAVSDQTQAVLASALYFAGQWSDPFLERETTRGTFRGPTREVRCHMMHRSHDMSASACEVGGRVYRAVWLPYASGCIEMEIILPEEGDTPLDGGQWDEGLLASLDQARKRQSIILSLPKWEYKFGGALGGALRSLGLRTVFDPGGADLAGMASASRPWLDDVYQASWIQVDEEGTEAACAAALACEAGKLDELPPEFTCDHPFLYLIRDMNTGAVLFLGRVMEPKE
jgi:serpin B